MPPLSRAFVTASWAAIGGIVGLAFGGWGVPLLLLQRPDLSLEGLLVIVVTGVIGWFAGAVVAWRKAGPRPPTSPVDVVLFLLGAAFVVWLGVSAATEIRLAHFGPMIDDIGPRHPILPTIATTYLVAATLVALSLVALALTREAPSGRRTAR